MKKKTNIRTVIRKIVREEVAMAIQEVITEITKPTKQVVKPQSRKKVVEEKSYTNNSVLNDVLNETAQSEEWKTMGGGTYDSSKMNEVMSSQYGNMMGENMNNSDIIAPQESPEVKNLFDRDFSGILKKSMEKTRNK
tara:strand:+ start:952 stop:1362 length:411 start_codon:yes stop_codon:yes gene_type:complete